MTFGSPIFRKLLLSSFLPIFAVLLALDFYMTRLAAEREVDGVQKVLTARAEILRGELAAVTPSGLAAWSAAVQSRTRSRITVIDPAGVVLADSEHDPQSMENHAARPEIQQAYRGAVGRAIRHSATLRRDLCYVAVPLAWQGKSGFVLRLAVPIQDLDAAIAAVRRRIWGASLVALGVALVIAHLFARSFTRRIRRLEAFGESLLSSHPAGELGPEPEDELGALARSLGGVGRQLREMVDKLSLEAVRRDAILSSMIEGVLAVDNELCVTFCNESFARTVGAGFPVPERRPLLQLVRDPALLEMLTRVLASGAAMKERLQLAAASTRAFEVQVAPLEAGSRRGAIAIFHDVTELERLERIRKDFVANVSHELRTPLAAIQGYAETLLDGALEDRDNNRRFLEIIRSQAVRLNNIASDLLTLSEMESGAPDPPPERVAIRETIESALNAVASEARVRGVRLFPGEIEDAGILGQRIRLEQVFVNLLTNAIKFNREGGEVRIETRSVSGTRIRITVADTGIGIPSEDLPRIFERFYRVDKARSRDLGGTGLGLSIVKHAVERMRGTISVQSQLGKGSTFTLEFPAL